MAVIYSSAFGKWLVWSRIIFFMAEILNLGENFKDAQYPQLRQVFSAAKLKHSKIINQAGKYQY